MPGTTSLCIPNPWRGAENACRPLWRDPGQPGDTGFSTRIAAANPAVQATSLDQASNTGGSRVKTVDEIASEYAARSPAAKADWYSAAAANYDRGRPPYPQAVVDDLVSRTAIGPASRILEIGSGPGTATQRLAPLGCTIDCVEPNPRFVEIARRRFRDHPNIRIHHCTFEAYEHRSGDVHVVLAATSMHWVSRDIAFAKSAQLLRSSGYLALLWNHELQPTETDAAAIAAIYARHAPGLFPTESDAQIEAKLESIGTWISGSGYFAEPRLGCIASTVCYSAQRYLDALQSYSPYLQLDALARENLLRSIGDYVAAQKAGAIDLRYLTGLHVARKV